MCRTAATDDARRTTLVKLNFRHGHKERTTRIDIRYTCKPYSINLTTENHIWNENLGITILYTSCCRSTIPFHNLFADLFVSLTLSLTRLCKPQTLWKPTLRTCESLDCLLRRSLTSYEVIRGTYNWYNLDLQVYTIYNLKCNSNLC